MRFFFVLNTATELFQVKKGKFHLLILLNVTEANRVVWDTLYTNAKVSIFILVCSDRERRVLCTSSLLFVFAELTSLSVPRLRLTTRSMCVLGLRLKLEAPL